MKTAIIAPVNTQRESEKNEMIDMQLNNGLRVIVAEDHTTPIVAVDIWYKVGSRDEKPGKSGFAHLFEHMMFEGSENVAKSEHMKIINDVGGIVNGSTTQDRTNYWEVVPANQLELVLWLEADRMRSLNLTMENFENQRDTVKEERRMRVDNQPYMRVLYEMKDEVAYTNFAYRHSVIGSMEDLDNASLEDVRRFHDLYYRPNNAVMSIVGDVEIPQTIDLVKKYFEEIPPGPPVPVVDLSEPPQQSEKRTQYRDPFAPFTAYLFAYHIPDRRHTDYYAIELLEKILFDGESSRLYRKLVEEQQLVLHLLGGSDGKFGPSLFFGFVQISPQGNIAAVEQTVRAELADLTENRITDKELEKAKNKIKADFYLKQESVRARADQFCMYATVFDKPGLLYQELDRYLAVTAEELREVATRYFTPDNRTVIEIFPRNEHFRSGA